MHGNGLRLCTVRAVPSGAPGDGAARVADKDGKSGTEAHPRATEVVSARRSTGLLPAGLPSADIV